MYRKHLVVFFSAVITLLGSARLLPATETPWTCEQGAQNSFVFLAFGSSDEACPWDIGSICHTWGMVGSGTVGTCQYLGQHPDEPAVARLLVTCTCVS